MVSISLVKRKYRDKAGRETTTKDWYAQIRFTEPNASYLRSTGTPDKRKAAEAARRLAHEIEESELPARGKPIFTLEGMFSKWIAEYGKDLRSGKDIAWQIKLILEIMGGETLIKTITNKTVHGFVQGAKERGKSEIVINRCLTQLRLTLRYAGKKWEAPVSDKIDWQDHFAKEPEEKEMYISPQEARLFVEVLPPHIGLAFAFSYYTGCRLNEMETLAWEKSAASDTCVDFEERVAIVKTKGRGKKPTYRLLRLSDKALTILRTIQQMPKPLPKRRMRRAEPNPSAVFNLENRRKHWERARKIVGREDIVWHGIRHSFGTETSRRAKAGEKLIGKMLGHAPGGDATHRYIHVMADDVYEALEHLPDIGMPKLLMHANGQVMQTLEANNNAQKVEKDVDAAKDTE